jgi:hypothetical protein
MAGAAWPEPSRAGVVGARPRQRGQGWWSGGGKDEDDLKKREKEEGKIDGPSVGSMLTGSICGVCSV